MPFPSEHPRDPLHGVTLEGLLKQLLAQHGWAEMGNRIPIRCFQIDPSIKSSLTFLRKTPWARQKVEDWFIEEQWNKQRQARSAATSRPTMSDDDQGRDEPARG